MPYVCKYGSPEQIERYIPDMTAGKIIGAIAMTEPGAGRLQTFSYSVGLMLADRLRCWANIKPTLIHIMLSEH